MPVGKAVMHIVIIQSSVNTKIIPKQDAQYLNPSYRKTSVATFISIRNK